MREEGKIIAEQRNFSAGKERQAMRAAKQQKQASGGWFWQISLGVLVICSLTWCWIKLANPQTFPIRAVQIKGNYVHVNREQLRKLILPAVQKGFVGIDLAALQDNLLQLPWVASAKVQRIWPDALMVVVTEQQPLARFNDNLLVNDQGDLFNIGNTAAPTGLPLFVGAAGQQKMMLQMYQRLLPLMAQLKLQLATLTLDPRQSWQLQFSNGLTVIVGQVDPWQRIERFFAVYSSTIAPKLGMIRSVDLRYAHGMAVCFKDSECEELHGKETI